MKSEKLLGWHFLANNGTSFGGYLPTELEQMDGDPVPCERGFHASRRVLDALEYAKGSILRRVELSGKIIESGNKACATRRRELWRIDAKPVLHEFARWCALQSVQNYWKPTPAVVIEYLTTGNESIREAAWLSSRHISEAATLAASNCPSWEAARATAEEIEKIFGKIEQFKKELNTTPNRKLTALLMQARKGGEKNV